MQETLVDVATNVASQEKEARSLRSNCWTGLTDSIKSNSLSLGDGGEEGCAEHGSRRGLEGRIFSKGCNVSGM